MDLQETYGTAATAKAQANYDPQDADILLGGNLNVDYETDVVLSADGNRLVKMFFWLPSMSSLHIGAGTTNQASVTIAARQLDDQDKVFGTASQDYAHDGTGYSALIHLENQESYGMPLFVTFQSETCGQDLDGDLNVYYSHTNAAPGGEVEASFFVNRTTRNSNYSQHWNDNCTASTTTDVFIDSTTIADLDNPGLRFDIFDLLSKETLYNDGSVPVITSWQEDAYYKGTFGWAYMSTKE